MLTNEQLQQLREYGRSQQVCEELLDEFVNITLHLMSESDILNII